MITNLHLRNFKCFEEQDFPFAPLTLLTGLNGMGKSSVIQALLLLRQSYKNTPFFKELILNGKYINLGTTKDIIYQYFTSKEMEISIDMEDENGKRPYRQTWVEENNKFTPNPRGHTYTFLKEIFQKEFQYFNAERIGPREFYSFSRDSDNPLGKYGEHAAQYLAQHFDDNIHLANLKHPKEQDSRLFMQINAWLSDIRPGTTVQAREFESLDLASLEFKLDKGPNAFRPTNVGFGLSYTLPILVALLTAQEGTFIILENPEAHLHPAGQAAIGKLLALAASQGVQIVVETHSDHLLNGVRVATKQFDVVQPEHTQILYFTGEHIDNRFQHYILTPKLDKNGKLDFWPEGFFDEYTKQLSQL